MCLVASDAGFAAGRRGVARAVRKASGRRERGAEGGNGSSNTDAKLLCRTANTKKKT